jgi:hypothetical protein
MKTQAVDTVVFRARHNSSAPASPVPVSRYAILFCLFSLVAWGLGYPALNRYDPRRVPGLADVKNYAAIVTGNPVPGPEHLQYRVLVPWIARPFYHLANGRSGTWDPAVFALLTANSLFVAGTALLIVLLGTRILRYQVGVVGALLYLLNFAVPNLRLVGLIDSGEGFFLLALYWILLDERFWLLPIIAALGALTKESVIPFSVVFTAAWWMVVRKRLASPVGLAAWIALSWIASLGTLMALHDSIGGHFESPLAFAKTLQGNYAYFSQFTSSIWDRNLWYVFVWLLPLAIPKLANFPKSWLIPTAATALTAFILDGFYSGAYGTVGRALFSIAGPLLALSCASFVLMDDPAGQALRQEMEED